MASFTFITGDNEYVFKNFIVSCDEHFTQEEVLVLEKMLQRRIKDLIEVGYCVYWKYGFDKNNNSIGLEALYEVKETILRYNELYNKLKLNPEDDVIRQTFIDSTEGRIVMKFHEIMDENIADEDF
jgi:ribonucleotide reductase beta subunit family protein with ferritin-like domain